jgi:glycosyltransferase involved in cell wall biosynthesis
MEPNGSVSAHARVGQSEAPSLKAESRAGRVGGEPRVGSNEFVPWRLLFVHAYCGEFGGAEASVHLAAAGLLNRGHRVGLVYERGTGRNEQDWRQMFQPCFEVPGKDKLDAVNDVVRQFRPDLIYLHKLADLEVLETLLQTGVPAVRMVHDHSLVCLRNYKYNYFTRKICRRPASFYCVFPCLASLERNPNGTLPVKWASYSRKQREMRLTKNCAGLVVYSQYQKEELVRNGFDAARIQICVPVRQGSNPSPVSSLGPNNVLLYVGQIIRGKGVDMLVRALAKVKEPFQCHILGEGNHLAYCKRLCARLGLQKVVHFWGYVPPAELEGYYLEASVFLMSSLWPEPFGMAGPEAMRYGLPVVAFDAGAIREWLRDGENGFLVKWKDTDTFAARVDELLRRKDLAKQLGQRGREWVKRYDPRRQLDELENLFGRLIGARKPAAREQEVGETLIGV